MDEDVQKRFMNGMHFPLMQTDKRSEISCNLLISLRSFLSLNHRAGEIPGGPFRRAEIVDVRAIASVGRPSTFGDLSCREIGNGFDVLWRRCCRFRKKSRGGAN